MDAQSLPAVIGTCPHCQLPVYADAAIAKGRPATHVACEVFFRGA